MLTHQLVLATDLDGTLLAGTQEARRRVRDLFSGGLAGAKLVYVTGRGLESIIPLLSDPTLPQPDYIIADVGATVVHGDLRPVDPLHHDIAARWPGSQAVLQQLAAFPSLQRQTVPQERRCSFFMSEGSISAELRAAVEALDCDLLFSAGRYLDVLPRGINKGATLRQLAIAEGFNLEGVVVAGDTLNDLSMYAAGFKGIVVGGAEPALIQHVRKMQRVYIASEEGCGGILSGLAHHGTKTESSSKAQSRLDERGDAELVMVYHRPPFDEVVEDGVLKRKRPKSPNGIIPTLLGFFAGERKGSWVAWSMQESRAPEGFVRHVPVDAKRFPNLKVARIALTPDDVDIFYKKFSKEAFWPIIFSFPDKAEFNDAHWQRFLEVNRIFAVQTAFEAAEGAVVWIHDYNLWMVPAFLRPLRPDLRIAFFHHTAFPSSDIFNILPWYREIIGSLLQCDYIGFHIPRYVENFVDAVRSYTPVEVLESIPCAPRFITYGCALGVDTVTSAIDVGGRRVALGAHPVGIDVALIEQIVNKPVVQKKIALINELLHGVKGIVSIERLDYVKGSLEKLQAFERLLEEHPELIGGVTLLNIITPAAPGMEIYETLRTEVDRLVGRINGRFSTLEWTPVRYFYRSLAFEDVVAHYAACDVAWITPLRDGLNLVAKEFVATKKATGTSGVLILSEFAGAAVELHGALLTNPYDANSMSKVLHQGLTMGADEMTYRCQRMAAIVADNNVARWGDEFMRAVYAA
ncbi:MAG: glucosylglycerol-phosphate synthase [Rhodoferax sp.]|uniref:glucosylglycerol-phosphate synthase n=1 Tax=Rhodoferax sp. TaxID=50421 RepID=UPI002639826C|nr:glucosylglycerol-phosphate synthase [Rhodoferax sp.]MDD2882607.1 glucosylglycerol-phosphate synthase [Rhodoferax sp.]